MKRNYKVTYVSQNSFKERLYDGRNVLQVTFEFDSKDDADKVFKEYEKLLKEKVKRNNEKE